MENQSYPENFAAYNSLDISSYVRQQFQHKYLSFRLSNASEMGNNFTLHSHKNGGCEPRIVIRKTDGSELILNATNGLEVRTLDPEANYNDISDYYDWGYSLFDSSFNVYNCILYLIFDLEQYPEAMALDTEMILSANLEISQFSGYSSPYYPALIRVTGLYDYPGNSRWSAETITWNNQPEIVLNNHYENDPGVIFRVYGDGTLLYESQPRKSPYDAVQLSGIDVTGFKEIVIEAKEIRSSSNTCTIWANAKLIYYNYLPLSRNIR